MKTHLYLQSVLQKNTHLIEELEIASKLFPLWKQWNSIVGEPIISYVYPIGTRKKNLIVGTYDSSSFQEMHYYKLLLLEQVNSFLQYEHFVDVIIEYNTSAHSLVQEANTTYPQLQQKKPPRQHIAQDIIPSTSSVANAYLAFLSLSLEVK